MKIWAITFYAKPFHERTRMATDDAEDSSVTDDGLDASEDDSQIENSVTVGEYSWMDFLEEYGEDEAVEELFNTDGERDGEQRNIGDGTQTAHFDWSQVSFSPKSYLGFDPDRLEPRLQSAKSNARNLRNEIYADPTAGLAPVSTEHYSLEHYKHEFSREKTSDESSGDDEDDPLGLSEELGFNVNDTDAVLAAASDRAAALSETIDQRTVDTRDLDEDDFFSTVDGATTVTNRYDLEKAVPMAKKRHFEELERYWVNKPYAFVIIFRSRKENETKYYLIEPHLTPIEQELRSFLSEKLRTAIKYASDEVLAEGDNEDRASVIDRELKRLLSRYDLEERDSTSDQFLSSFIDKMGDSGFFSKIFSRFGVESEPESGPTTLRGIEARPEPTLIEEDKQTLSQYQVEKIKYHLKRDFVGYERIDGIKHDINVEDISCDGYNSPVFVYHTDYEQLITNIYHGEERLDDFVVKLAQRSGKGISKRQPQVDATLPDGSRAQLTLGSEVSDHGTIYTIRQFKDVPFTPIDLINWHTFSLDQMAYLWLCIENHKSLIFAGGTASGKTTSLNAVSLFIPSNAKIVSIEDTREVELPQRNWIASVTRPSFSQDDQGDIDEFDLLEAALRQRPDYIVMGEIRGEEGRTLFQVMSTGHTTYTTFHADTVGEVLKRFTTEPINVSKTLFTALDLVSIQTQTRVQGTKVRKSKSITEINHYDAENDEINVQDVYQWRAETDEFNQVGESSTLDEIMFDRGWSHDRLQEELFKRRVILSYLIREGLNQYAQVAAAVQAFINDPDTLLALIANDVLEESLEDLREMESVLIDIDPEKEALVPRPDPTDEVYKLAGEILAEAEDRLFDQYKDVDLDETDLLAAIEPMQSESEDETVSVSETAPATTDEDGSLDELERWIKEGGAMDGDSEESGEEPTPALSPAGGSGDDVTGPNDSDAESRDGSVMNDGGVINADDLDHPDKTASNSRSETSAGSSGDNSSEEREENEGSETSASTEEADDEVVE